MWSLKSAKLAFILIFHTLLYLIISTLSLSIKAQRQFLQIENLFVLEVYPAFCLILYQCLLFTHPNYLSVLSLFFFTFYVFHGFFFKKVLLKISTPTYFIKLSKFTFQCKINRNDIQIVYDGARFPCTEFQYISNVQNDLANSTIFFFAFILKSRPTFNMISYLFHCNFTCYMRDAFEPNIYYYTKPLFRYIKNIKFVNILF